MKRLPAASHRVMPWKNGLGETAEIARFAEEPARHEFDWRVSVARVDGSGPFSAFPGVDRVIAQLTGPPMTLRFEGEGRAKTLACLEPFAFPGEASIHAELSGPGSDFNVMVRRGVITADVSCVALRAAAERVFEMMNAWLLLYCVQGNITARSGRMTEEGVAGDALLVDASTGTERVSVSGHGDEATVLVVELRKPRR